MLVSIMRMRTALPDRHRTAWVTELALALAGAGQAPAGTAPSTPPRAAPAMTAPALQAHLITLGLLTGRADAAIALWRENLAQLPAHSAALGHDAQTRAFFFAGARALMVSHWPIDDAVTPQLMADTMARSSEGLSRAQALRQAQLAMNAMQEHAHPFYWAPFSVEGENR